MLRIRELLDESKILFQKNFPLKYFESILKSENVN